VQLSVEIPFEIQSVSLLENCNILAHPLFKLTTLLHVPKHIENFTAKIMDFLLIFVLLIMTRPSSKGMLPKKGKCNKKILLHSHCHLKCD